MSHQHQLSPIWEQRLCSVAQLCDLPRMTWVPPRGTGDSVGTSCPALVLLLLSPVAVHTRCPHAPQSDSGSATPPPVSPTLTQVFSRHIYFCTHFYTQFPGQLHPHSRRCLRAGSALRWGHPRISGGAGAKPVPPTPFPSPVVSTWGEKPPAAPRAGPCTVPLPQFPPGQRGGADPHQHRAPTAGSSPPTRVNFGAPDAEAAPVEPPGGGVLHHPDPRTGWGIRHRFHPPAPAAPRAVLGGSGGVT